MFENNGKIMHKVFVYGTLKRGQPNHYLMQNLENGYSKYLSNASISQKYPLVIGTKYNIPFLLDCPGKGYNVEGEIYEVDDKMVSHLDILEDHPNFYIRRLEPVITSIEKEEICWTYFLPKFHAKMLEKEMLQNYDNNTLHHLKYCERYYRDPNYNYKVEVQFSGF